MISHPLLELADIHKRFGGVHALRGVDFDLRSGEVHVLFGENGAGKSTLINIITGTIQRDSGSFRLDGRAVTSLSPQEARAAGISAVFQEFSLVPDLTAEENLFLGREVRRMAILDRAAMRQRAREFFASVGFSVPVRARVADLSRAERQMLEIAKALFGQARILILDEPTASLTDDAADRLFRTVEALKAKGVGIVYVSHRMREIKQLADRITVLRGGKKVATVDAEGVTEGKLVEMMVGRPVGDFYPTIRQEPSQTRLSVENLSSADGRVRNVSLHVRSGEIVGIAGLVGCGKGEVQRLIFGIEPKSAGRILLDGQEIADPSPRGMLRAGVCYFPSDRGTEGLAHNRPVRENASAAALDLAEIGGRGVLHRRSEALRTQSVLERLSVRPLLPEDKISQFSGGNRQKVMLARGLMRRIDVFLFDEPTVGIDVGAKTEVYQLMRDLVEAGAAVLLASSELPEIMNLANRIYVMHEGEIVRQLVGDERTEAAILASFFGKAQAARTGRAAA